MESYLPAITGVVDAMRYGRNPYEGYQRGWGLEYGDLKTLISLDPLYKRASALANGYSIISEERRMNLFLLVRFFLQKISKGHIIEFGSYRGGNAMFLAILAKELFPGMKIYALDTFQGMPPTNSSIDLHQYNDFSDANYTNLLEMKEKNKIDNLIIVKGLFEDTAEGALRDAGSIALAHIDCDISSSVLFSYQAVIRHMIQDGYIVFDDATTSTCIGATEIVEEHLIRGAGLHSEQIWPHFVFRSALGSLACPEEQIDIASMVRIPTIDSDLISVIASAHSWSARVEALEGSTSWRLTRPLRALSRAWRALSIDQ